MKKFSIIACFAAAVILVVSCSDVKRKRGLTYMPDMADSRAYETYSPSPIYKDGQASREPVAGTIKRGELLPFHVAKDAPGDTANYVASRQVRNPLTSLNGDEMKEAERLYLVNCAICHGTKLDGNGPLYKGGDGPFPAKPATLVGDATFERMPDGQMFYSVTYGKNLMGPYSSQLDTKQRWMVIAYIKSKQAKPAASPTPAGNADSTAKKTAAK